MKRTGLFIYLLLFCLACGAKQITIIPKYTVGDTLRYRMTSKVILYHGKDSLVTLTSFLPEVFVEDRNDKGFILSTSNRLESNSVECSDPGFKKLLPLDNEELNAIVEGMKLRIQLDAAYRPDSILNLQEVKESLANAYLELARKTGDANPAEDAEWEIDTEFLIGRLVNEICTLPHIIDEQFGNIPYFSFAGIPLKSGKIPASMALTDELQLLCGIEELKMTVCETGEEGDGFYSIDLKGKKRKSNVDGSLLYADGILCHGYLEATIKSDSEEFIIFCCIDGIPDSE